MQQQDRGITGITVDEVFIGNGVSELIALVLRALLNPGDEVLVPSPDYPLWPAAVTLNGGRAVHYPCRPPHGVRAGPSTASCPIRRKWRASSPRAPARSSSSTPTIRAAPSTLKTCCRSWCG